MHFPDDYGYIYHRSVFYKTHWVHSAPSFFLYTYPEVRGGSLRNHLFYHMIFLVLIIGRPLSWEVKSVFWV
jgi:hypothetical protein